MSYVNTLADRIVLWNERAAVNMSNWLATAACIYLFALWSMLPFIYAPIRDFDSYVSQDIIQLVALAVIPFAGKVSERAIRAQTAQQHDLQMEMIESLRQQQKMHTEEMCAIKRLVTQESEELCILRRIEGKL